MRKAGKLLRIELFKFAEHENGRTYVAFADSKPHEDENISHKASTKDGIIPRMVAICETRYPV